MIGRIRDRASFDRLRREGRRARIDPLWCSFVLDPGVTPPAVAFAIGRATGNAVRRNQLRRRLRSLLAQSDVPPGLYLFGAGARACEHTYDDLDRTVVRLLERVRSMDVRSS